MALDAQVLQLPPNAAEPQESATRNSGSSAAKSSDSNAAIDANLSFDEHIEVDGIVEDVKVDVANDPASGADVGCRQVKPKKASSRRRVCCCVCFLSLLAVAGSAIAFCWPRYPEWEITELAFTDETKNGLVSVFTDPTYNETATFDGVAATVNFWNANYVGAQAGNGQFKIFYEAEEVGTAEVVPVAIPGRSNVTIQSRATMTITPDAARLLLAGVMKSIEQNSVITVRVSGVLPATALGVFTVNMIVNCHVSAEAIKMMIDPNQMVTGHNCTYSIDY